MEPSSYYNPPSEREWTIAEREEFFAGQDALTCVYNNASMPTDQIRPLGISVTSITPPSEGWPIALYCPICKETTFVLSPWGVKPTKGNYWLIEDMCGREEVQHQHNAELLLKQFPKPDWIYGK